LLDQRLSGLCDDYRQRGLLGASNIDGLPILRTTLDVTAIHMPAGLGRRVLEDLLLRMIAGPAMARPGVVRNVERWTVFCWENRLPKQDAVAELDRAGASICALGSPLLLPSGYSRIQGEPWWIQPPGAELPPLSAVVAVTQIMACGLSPW
jgi:hypothetical protein